MFVEGTLRWRVTEDCPWDLLFALCLRELTDMTGSVPLDLPALAFQRSGLARQVSGRVRARAHPVKEPECMAPVERQWLSWWQQLASRPPGSLEMDVRPPHFSAFDRVLDLQDAVIEHFDDAARWADQERADYVRRTRSEGSPRMRDVSEVVREREHVLRRQAGYFRLNLIVLPLAEDGAWIIAPDTMAISAGLRGDRERFRRWFSALVVALV